jgi:hypothetical protein
MPIRDEDGHRAMQAAGKAWKAIKTSGKRLGEKGRNIYRQERLGRRDAEMGAAWLAEHGTPMRSPCSMNAQQEMEWYEPFARTPDFTDQHFDVTPDPVEPAEPSPHPTLQ